MNGCGVDDDANGTANDAEEGEAETTPPVSRTPRLSVGADNAKWLLLFLLLWRNALLKAGLLFAFLTGPRVSLGG
jgi:hypothetical protein